MCIDELTNLLNKEFIKVYKNVLINGNWGIEKTHFINQYVKGKNHIYISLFGIDSIENFKLNIYMQLDKVLGFMKNVNKKLEGISISVPIGSISVPYIEGDIIKKVTKKAQNNELIIIVDDLERKSSNILMEELLGIIEEFNKIPGIYVIIIANEQEIKHKEQKEIYFSFKEKIIQKTFNVTYYSESARRNIVSGILKEIDNLENKEKYLNYIEEFLLKHKIMNLRTIEKAMKFLQFIFSEMDIAELIDHEINAIIIASLSVVIEKIENLYYKDSDSKKHSIAQMITNDFIQRVVRNYFREQTLISDKVIIVGIISNIYDDIEIEYNFNRLSNYFKSEHSQTNEEKSLFYKSKRDLEIAIEEFYNNSILKVNEFLDIDMWLKKFAEVNYYATIINKTDWVKEEEVEKIICEYVNKIKNIEKEVQSNVYRFYHLDQYVDDRIRKLCDSINQKINDKYICDLVEMISEETNRNNYDEQKIVKLFDSNGAGEKNNIQKIINMLDDNKYFLPNLSENLNEKSWGFTHAIWRYMGRNVKNRDKKFEIFVKNLLKATDEVGMYRIKSLNNQYHIKLDEKMLYFT